MAAPTRPEYQDGSPVICMGCDSAPSIYVVVFERSTCVLCGSCFPTVIANGGLISLPPPGPQREGEITIPAVCIRRVTCK